MDSSEAGQLPLEFTFKGEHIKIGPATLIKHPSLRHCSKLADAGSVPAWMEPRSLKLFLKLVIFQEGFQLQEQLVGRTADILRLLWYSDFFAMDSLQVFILRRFALNDLHVVNAVTYLHEGLKKIGNTSSLGSSRPMTSPAPEWWLVIQKAHSIF